jgi:hypothetical protein
VIERHRGTVQGEAAPAGFETGTPYLKRGLGQPNRAVVAHPRGSFNRDIRIFPKWSDLNQDMRGPAKSITHATAMAGPRE